MPETESFDAFYARTVWNVTSQLHALAGEDSAADHAIREAYARAYQQWYEVSGYRDPEGWVLSVAKDGYQRRRPDGPLTARPASTGPADDDSGTWPGIYRPTPGRGEAGGEPADRAPASPTYAPGPTWSAAAASVGPAGAGSLGAGSVSAAPAGAGTADQAGLSGVLGQHSAGATTALASPAPARPTSPVRRLDLPALGSRKALIAVAVAIAVVAAAAIAYVVASGGHKTPAAAGSQKTVTPPGKPKPHMLGAGHTGRRSAIPWSLIGAGWTLAEVSTAPPASAGGASTGGTYTTYLVDPKGGKYLITTAASGSAPQLVAWSGDADNALYTMSGAGGASPSYGLLSLHTGQLAPLQLPANVNAVGFTRPDGLNILAVRQGPAMFKLQRYDLNGTYEATIGELARKPGESWNPDVCGTGCSALSSPNGDTAVWGIAGDEMQVISNAGGHARKLRVPDSGTPPSCVPINWWNADTVLATCAATNGSTPGASRLWLVPTEGGAPTPLTQPGGGGSGTGDNVGAWTAGATVYVNSTSATQCAGAPSGPGGLEIIPASQAGSGSSPATIAGSTGDHNTVVAGVGDRLLVLAQTSCPGTSSLVWYRPASGTTQPLLTEPSGQVGVIEAVPFGNGPVALAAGM
jgi:hypothetical protein